MPPRPWRRTKRGAASAAGRRSTRPSVLVNSRLVTGSGAVTLTTPSSSSSWSAHSIAAEQVVEARPTPSTGRRRRAACPAPALKAGSIAGERPAGALTTMPRRGVTSADAGVRGRRRRLLPGAADVGEEALAELRLLGDAPRRRGSRRRRPRRRSTKTDGGESMRAIASASVRVACTRLLQDGLPAAGGPDAAERHAGEVHDRVDALEGAVVRARRWPGPSGTSPGPASALRTSRTTRWPAVVR